MKRAKAIGLGFNQILFKNGIDPAAAGAFVKRLTEFSETFGRSSGDGFNVAVLSVADPAAKVELSGLAMDKPAESDALDATFD